MPHGIPRGAMCVQRFDDSLNSAIHTTYRISLRSSSMPEPRDPLLKVVTIVCIRTGNARCKKRFLISSSGRLPHRRRTKGARKKRIKACGARECYLYRPGLPGAATNTVKIDNDPSAGSPTETLLRLLLPLNDRVCTTFRLEVVVANLLEPVRRPH